MNKKKQTLKTFENKWTKNNKLAFDFTATEGSTFFDWILKRNGFESPEKLAAFLSSKNNILDAGCGNGRVTALLNKYGCIKTKLEKVPEQFK